MACETYILKQWPKNLFTRTPSSTSKRDLGPCIGTEFDKENKKMQKEVFLQN